MARIEDIDQPGGWLVRVITPGNPPIERFFKVYEVDQLRAVELVMAAERSDNVEAIRQLNIHEFTGDGMTPGQVKQH